MIYERNYQDIKLTFKSKESYIPTKYSGYNILQADLHTKNLQKVDSH